MSYKITTIILAFGIITMSFVAALDSGAITSIIDPNSTVENETIAIAPTMTPTQTPTGVGFVTFIIQAGNPQDKTIWVARDVDNLVFDPKFNWDKTPIPGQNPGFLKIVVQPNGESKISQFVEGDYTAYIQHGYLDRLETQKFHIGDGFETTVVFRGAFSGSTVKSIAPPIPVTYNEINLVSKDSNWQLDPNGPAGIFGYNSTYFEFNASGLKEGDEYVLISYAEPYPGKGSNILGSGQVDANGEIKINATDYQLIYNNYCGYGDPRHIVGDYSDVIGAKVWLVSKTDFDGTKFISWNPNQYLFEDELIISPNQGESFECFQLVTKDQDQDWKIVDNAWGAFRYNSNHFEFEGTKLAPNTFYQLISYKESYPGSGSVEIGEGTSDEYGNLKLSGDIPTLIYNDYAGFTTGDYRDVTGAKIWLVANHDFNGFEFTVWNPTTYLFETRLIDGIPPAPPLYYDSVPLVMKNPSDWETVAGATGLFRYNATSFEFNATGLGEGTYKLISYSEPYPGENSILLATGTTDGGGNIKMSGDKNLVYNYYNCFQTGDYTSGSGAKIWLVRTEDFDGHFLFWNPTTYLFEDNLIPNPDTKDYSCMQLMTKNPSGWVKEPEKGYGIINYNADSLIFGGERLEPNTEYTLISYAEPYPGSGSQVLATGSSNGYGNIKLSASLGSANFINNNYDCVVEGDYHSGVGAKIWLIKSADYNSGHFIAWNPTQYLFENDLIYGTTDLTSCMNLIQKDSSWNEVTSGTNGIFHYNNGRFEFVAQGLTPGNSYEVVSYAEPWPGTGSKSLGIGTADEFGVVKIDATLDKLVFNDYNFYYPFTDTLGAKIWLVNDADFEGGQFTTWNPTQYLFERSLILQDPPLTFQYMKMVKKTPSGTWPIISTNGLFRFDSATNQYLFRGYDLTANTGYTLISYKEPWPGTGSAVLGSGTTDASGVMYISGSTALIQNTYTDTEYAGHTGAKVWLIPTTDYSGGDIAWNPANFLFETDLVPSII